MPKKQEKWVPAAEARIRLRKLSEGQLFVGIIEGLIHLNEEKGILGSDLKIFEEAYRAIGPGKTNSLVNIILHTTVSKQIEKPRLRKLVPQSDAARKLFVLRHFLPKLLRIISNKKLNRHYRLVAYGLEATDKPFSNSLRVFGKKVGQVCSFNYDLFFDRQGKPCVVLGSIQHFGSKPSQEFKKRMGLYPLNFFIKTFSDVFSPKNIVALNVKHHVYRKEKLARYADIVAAGMVSKKELREEDFEVWRAYHKFGVDPYFVRIYGVPGKELLDRIQATEDTVQKKIKEVETFDTGLHKSAYKKAGFKITRSRYWRQEK